MIKNLKTDGKGLDLRSDSAYNKSNMIRCNQILQESSETSGDNCACAVNIIDAARIRAARGVCPGRTHA